MRCRQHDVEESGLIGAQVQSAVRVDIRFDSPKQSKPLTDRLVDPVDGAALVNGLGADPCKLRQPAFFCNEIGEGRFQR
jgi:hypothetical protein